MIYIYNTLTRRKEKFIPIEKNKIKIYVCGLTAYDKCHIGHARMFVWFDTIVRYLRALKYEVIYVRNITDIDDKIINKANDLNIPYSQLTNRIINSMHEEERKLNIIPPTFEPRVTEHIQEIISMIQILIDKGYAYITDDNDVYYRIEKFKKYGELAHKNIECLSIKTRIDFNIKKNNLLDFVLWKSAKDNEPFWSSPWGNGRPGWHIECSAMAQKYLGAYFDIHGGGSDLQFPHHQNEIAQSEAANGCTLSNIWMHVGLIKNNHSKMSKSIGNFYSLNEILKMYHPEVLRLFMLSSHYRSSINFSQEILGKMDAALRRLYISLYNLSVLPDLNYDDDYHDEIFYKNFHSAMNDDFNTPKAISILFTIIRKANKYLNINLPMAKYWGRLAKYLANTLGLLLDNPHNFVPYNSAKDQDALIQDLIIQRNLKRKENNWEAADAIRESLNKMGINIKDNSDGTTNWYIDIKQYTKK